MKKTIRVLQYQYMRALDSGVIKAFIFANLRAMERVKLLLICLCFHLCRRIRHCFSRNPGKWITSYCTNTIPEEVK